MAFNIPSATVFAVKTEKGFNRDVTKISLKDRGSSFFLSAVGGFSRLGTEPAYLIRVVGVRERFDSVV